MARIGMIAEAFEVFMKIPELGHYLGILGDIQVRTWVDVLFVSMVLPREA